MGFEPAKNFARPPRVEQFVDQFLTAICERSRRHILECLSPIGEEEGALYERSVGEIAEQLGLAASTTSEHLQYLVKMRVLTSRRQGKKSIIACVTRRWCRPFRDCFKPWKHTISETSCPRQQRNKGHKQNHVMRKRTLILR